MKHQLEQLSALPSEESLQGIREIEIEIKLLLTNYNFEGSTVREMATDPEAKIEYYEGIAKLAKEAKRDMAILLNSK